jgi:hypothetical protein
LTRRRAPATIGAVPLAALVLLALLATLVAAPPSPAAKGPRTAKLERFSDCGELVRYARRHRDRYEPGGRPDGPVFTPPPPAGAPGPGGEGGPVAAPEPSDGGQDFSGTNVQEAGVFEPDIVKTDGRTVYALTSTGVLHTVDVRGAPAALGSLPLGEGYGHQMLRDGRTDRLLVTWGDASGQTSTIALVDVADPAAPALLRTLTVDGQVLASRRTDRTVRVVLAVRPYAYAAPERADTGRASAWLPRGRFFDARRETTSQRRLVGCRAVRRTRAFSGLEQLTVLTINLDEGLDPVDADAVMTGGETVYASAGNLYVATQRYRPALEDRTSGPVPEGIVTHVHRFSLDDADTTAYRGSGIVPGFALNQFSLSEHRGVLRVATTDTPPWFGGENPSESFVTTLRADAAQLVQAGQVGGIGRGERIFAVRFLGDTGYVVTFEQTDPLFTIDLSDPERPRVLGELVIPGFSSYLHPIAGDRLIGVGTGPDEQAGTFGLQVSLFDVSDLSDPRLEHRVTFDGGSSEVAYDHHAFLWWQPRDLAVLPVQTYEHGDSPSCAPDQPCPGGAAYARPKADAVGLTVRPAGIAEAGRVAHDGAVVRRSIVIGDRLITVSDAGVKASSLDTWADSGFAPF